MSGSISIDRVNAIKIATIEPDTKTNSIGELATEALAKVTLQTSEQQAGIDALIKSGDLQNPVVAAHLQKETADITTKVSFYATAGRRILSMVETLLRSS